MLRLFGLHRLPARTVTEEELKALLVEGAQTGVLELEERDMIERVLRLADKPVRAIMTPRTELAWIDRTDPPKDIALALKAAPHSRIVVCEGSIDNVVGIVQAKDLLDRILSGGDLSIGAALRQPIVVPDTVTALDALERLKTDTLGLALVLDEYGSFEGLVTVADMLEAIVGDPADTAAQPAEPGDEGETSLVMDGMMPVDEAKARLSLPDLPGEGTYHTLAGLLLALLRRVPKAGRPDRVRGLAVRGAGDGWTPGRKSPGPARAVSRGVTFITPPAFVASRHRPATRAPWRPDWRSETACRSVRRPDPAGRDARSRCARTPS